MKFKLKLKKPKLTRRGIMGLSVAGTLVVLVAAFLAAYAVGWVNSPRLDAALGKGDAVASAEITDPMDEGVVQQGAIFEGTYEGDGVVYLWVKGVNFAVPTESSHGEWRYQYPGGLEGRRVVQVALVTSNGWGEPSSQAFNFTYVEPSAPTRYYSDELGGFGKVLKPVERGIRGAATVIVTAVENVIGYVDAGGDGDLDGNGVDDRVQGSVAPPSTVWGSIPYGNIVLLVLVALAIIATVYVLRAKVIHDYLVKRREQRLARERSDDALEVERIKAKVALRSKQIDAAAKIRAKQGARK